MIVITQSGNFNHTERFLTGAKKLSIKRILESYGEEGVRALSEATPVDSGLTASSWSYKIEYSKGSYSIYWTNANVVDGVPIAILIQYGHGTGTGGYVKGVDYINPAMRKIFEEIANSAWQEVKNL